MRRKLLRWLAWQFHYLWALAVYILFYMGLPAAVVFLPMVLTFAFFGPLDEYSKDMVVFLYGLVWLGLVFGVFCLDDETNFASNVAQIWKPRD